MDRLSLKVATRSPAKAAVRAKLVATEGKLTAEAAEIKNNIKATVAGLKRAEVRGLKG
jgi:hypothetical protein